MFTDPSPKPTEKVASPTVMSPQQSYTSLLKEDSLYPGGDLFGSSVLSQTGVGTTGSVEDRRESGNQPKTGKKTGRIRIGTIGLGGSKYFHFQLPSSSWSSR